MEKQKVEVTDWRFQVDHNDLGEKRGWFESKHDKSGWMQVLCPQPWDFYQEAFRGFEGIGWYAAELNEDWINTEMLQRIIFNSVSGLTRVWVNGTYLGEHIGSYLPFEFIVTPYLNKDSANEIIIKVDNRPHEDWLPGSPRIEWVQYGGILQKVVLESTSISYISALKIRTETQGTNALVFCEVVVTNLQEIAFTGQLKLELPDGEQLYTTEKTVECAANAQTAFQMIIELPNAKLWDLETPYLYYLTAILSDANFVIDWKKERFGIRTIEAKGKDILLNGVPILIKGINRYDEFVNYGPDAPEEMVREELMLIKAMGANLIRVHYPQAPLHLDIMDEIGLLLMEEIPLNWWMSEWDERVYYPQVIDMAEVAIEHLIERDRNHPCVIIWSMCNESGTNKEVGIQAMLRLMRRARQLDSTRLITFVATGSGGHDAFAEADIICTNLYYGVFSDKPQAMEISEFEYLVRIPTENNLIKTATVNYPDKPLLLSEFGTHGVYGLKGKDRFSETYQAAYIESVWTAVENAKIQGGILWVWADYRHRRDFFGTDGLNWNAPFGPYGVVTIDRKLKETFHTLSRLFGAKL